MPTMVSPVQGVHSEKMFKLEALHMPKANARESSLAGHWCILDSLLIPTEDVQKISLLLQVARMAQR